MTLKFIGAFCAISVAFAASASASPCDTRFEPGGPPVTAHTSLTLSAALDKVRHASPAVRAAGLETRARQADADQSGRQLNPTLSVELENFGGNSVLSSFGQSETTVSLSQTIQFGGKRRRAEATSRALAALASAECEVILRESELQAATLYYDLAGATQTARLAQEAATLADDLRQIVEKRVSAGDEAPPELLRVEAEAATARAQATEAAALAQRGRYDLAILWGGSAPDFVMPETVSISAVATGSDENPTDAAARITTEHPLLTRADAALDASEARRRLERARRVPDVTFSTGYRRVEGIGINGAGADTIIAGISLPLQIFNRNRDAVRAAAFRSAARAIDRRAVAARLLAEQQASVAAVTAAQNRLAALETEALPAATAAYDASLRGYTIGRFDLTTTLNIRRSLIDTQFAVIDARRALNAADMRLRSLIGAAPFSGDSHDQ